MKRAWLGAMVGGALLATAGSAMAQEIPVPAWSAAPGAEDVVVLKDGGAVRGLVMEVLPNDHVSVKMSDGRTAIIAWSVVHHIEQGARPQAPTPAPVTPAPTPSSAPNTSSAPTPVTHGLARVHMESSNADAVLEQEHGGAWAVACAGSCDRDLPIDAAYRVNGPGVRTGGSFRLLAKPGDHVTLHVNTSSSAAFTGGVTMALLGGLAGTVGFWGWYVTLINNAENSYSYDYYGNGNYNSHQQHSVAPWAITTGIGAAVGTIGLIMAVSNEKTKVNQTAATSEKSASLKPLSDREPTWLNLKPAGMPNAQSSPIFSLKF
ncbi:MAG: hypothetical protein ABI461_18470 [Polyangiaceae bacterium]